jgi:hypothetical protein
MPVIHIRTPDVVFIASDAKADVPLPPWCAGHATRQAVRHPKVPDHGGQCGQSWGDVNCSGRPHITRIGKRIRRFNLDEVPQFINVFKGKMNVVGLRPQVA